MNYGTVFISELENVDAPEKIIEIEGDSTGRFFDIIYLFAHKIENLERVGIISHPQQFERNDGTCRVWVKPNHFSRNCQVARGYFVLTK